MLLFIETNVNRFFLFVLALKCSVLEKVAAFGQVRRRYSTKKFYVVKSTEIPGGKMERPKICLTLTGKTIKEDLELIEKYRNYVDIVELRGDFLEDDERLHIRKFPSLAKIPCILTLRRVNDGGMFKEGEAARTILFGRALAFTEETKKFEYIDFEEDFHIPSLQDAALAFEIKIIRSVHNMHGPVTNIKQRLESLCTSGYEIPKIAFMPESVKDVENLFKEASELKDNNHILIAMGDLGLPSRILSARLKNYLTFVSAKSGEGAKSLSHIGHLDPVTLNDVYRFKSIDENTKLYGITGWPLTSTSSPEIHNKGYELKKINAVYVPFCGEKFEDVMSFANAVGVEGLSVTIPHKEEAASYADEKDEKVKSIGASNTLVKKDGKWFAYNTDAPGFAKSLLEFCGLKNLKHKKVAIIGAGGAAKGIAWAVKNLKGKACVFNRTVTKAKNLAEQYGFEYASLSPESANILKKYSDIIIQTTSKGMYSTEESNSENDPIFFYEFTGKEMLFDIVYVPAVTPVMARAESAGCKVINGFNMLKYQGYEQFELYTGVEYDGNFKG